MPSTPRKGVRTPAASQIELLATVTVYHSFVTANCRGKLTDCYSSLASSVISALRTFETGQFFSASFAISANLLSSRFGTLARRPIAPFLRPT
jgi:hypothetical protein